MASDVYLQESGLSYMLTGAFLAGKIVPLRVLMYKDGMGENLCRDIVLYMPVWRADWKDEVPALVSEAEFLESLITNIGPVYFDEPWTWESPLTLMQPGPVPTDVSVQRGESYRDLEWEAYLTLTAPIAAIDYSFNWVNPEKKENQAGSQKAQALDYPMPASLSQIHEEISDTDTDEEIDELANDPDAASLVPALFDTDMEDADDQNGSGGENGSDGNKGSDGDNSDASDPDAMDDDQWLGRCDYCDLPLGHNTRVPSRVFRCRKCKSDLQCESCCHTIHVCKPSHPLEEWDPTVDADDPEVWFETRFRQTGLVSAHPTCCGVCKMVLALPGRKIPGWALLCEECGCGVMCQQCCFKKHEKAPLHWVKSWNGNFWEQTTLREHGFVYKMGHGGDPCPHPDKFVSSLLVIGFSGANRIHLRMDGTEPRLTTQEFVVHSQCRLSRSV
ncbi:hypothetical protein B0H11DRAFT_2251860 [Mycena galericulata]|nr:hypothetical protein B0H11DRAFT_2251860 [Mycena galericulata]